MSFIGAWIDGLLLVAGAHMAAIGYIVPVIGAAVVTLSGELLFKAFGLAAVAGWLSAAFVAGTTLTSVAMLVPTWILHWSAQDGFLAWSGLVLVAAVLAWRPLRDAPPVPWHGAAIPLAFALLVAWFSRHQIAAEPTLMQTGVLPSWLDYFAHGTTIASFGSPLAIHAGNIMLPGTPRVFYHYGTFMIPAALSQMTGLSGLALGTAVGLPLGLLVGLCGLFALAAAWVGTGPALLTVWLVACLPGAAHQALHNGFYGFHWLLYTNPGAGYAIGAGAVAILCLLQWFEGRRASPLLLCALLTVMLIMIRVHMFLLLAPALIAAVILAVLPLRWRVSVFVAGLLAVAALSVLLIAGLLGSLSAQLIKPANDFISLAFNDTGPAVYATFLHHRGPVSRVLIGALLLLPATLGFWVLALPLVSLWAVMRRDFRPADTIPWLLCIVYLLLIIWTPSASNGDVDEYKQRHFVLLYAIVVAWSVARVLALAGVRGWLSGWRPARAVLTAAACGALTVLATRHVDAARPSARMHWAGPYYGMHVEPGIPAAARFIRAHARAGDMMAVGGSGADPGLTGPAVELVSMTDEPCYVGRIDQVVATGPPAIVAVVKRRAADLKAVDGAPDQDAAFALLRARGIRWYVVVAPNWPAWDKGGSKAAFHAGSVYVYSSGPEAGAKAVSALLAGQR